MSDATAAAIPPGWYPDATAPGQLRWWSGTEWTEHVSAPAVAAPQDRPLLPADRPVYSVFIWLIALLPLVSVGLIFAWQPSFHLDVTSPSSVAIPASILTPGYFLIIGASWVLYGLCAVFAWRDSVWLRAQGVVRPFPWPWVFLQTAVYVIGRSVIVHRVAAPRGRGPIWALIAVYVLGFAASIVWTVLLFSQLAAQLPSYSTYGS